MRDNLRPYPEYKDSGVDWLEKVPAKWFIKRAKGCFEVIDIRSRTGNEEKLTVSSSVGVVPRSRQKVTMFEAASYVGHKLCWPGDLVINSLWAWMGGLGFARQHGLVSSAYSVYRPKAPYNQNWRYLDYLLRSAAYDWEFRVRSKGVWTSRLQLLDSEFMDMPIIIPPPDEQAAIVAFLDAAEKRIRRYIRAKQKLIALLNEQKQAIIQQAVTRGLNPDVPMKDSGVAWLGEIPAHWGGVNLRYLSTKFGSGITPRGGAQVYQEEGVPFLRSQNIHFDGLRLDKVAYIAEDLHSQLSSTHVRPYDILLNITGASIGRVCTIPSSFLEGNVNQHVCIIRPKLELIAAEYLSLFLSTPIMQHQIYIASNGASREGLSLKEIKDFYIFLPPLEEQQQIVNTLESQLSELRALSAQANYQIELIREYRTRLIADVVTGKVDVRGLAFELPEAFDEDDLLDVDEDELPEEELEEVFDAE
jgi:type I restriction enzyme, S subunit